MDDAGHRYILENQECKLKMREDMRISPFYGSLEGRVARRKSFIKYLNVGLRRNYPFPYALYCMCAFWQYWNMCFPSYWGGEEA